MGDYLVIDSVALSGFRFLSEQDATEEQPAPQLTRAVVGHVHDPYVRI